MEWPTIIVVLVLLAANMGGLVWLLRPIRNEVETQPEPTDVPNLTDSALLTRLEQLEQRMTALHETTEERYKRMHGLVAQQKRRYDQVETAEEEAEVLAEQMRIPIASQPTPGSPSSNRRRGRMVPMSKRR